MRLTFQTQYATVIKTFNKGDSVAEFLQQMISLQARLVDVEVL